MRSRTNERGVSFLEVFAALSLLAVVSGTTLFDMRQFNDPTDVSARDISAFLKEVRSRSMSVTLAYTVVPQSNRKLVTYYSNGCDDEVKIKDQDLDLELIKGASLNESDWQICYDPRGLADTSMDIAVVGNNSGARAGRVEYVQVLLGGSVRVKPRGI